VLVEGDQLKVRNSSTWIKYNLNIPN